jgi:hypothetical protein
MDFHPSSSAWWAAAWLVRSFILPRRQKSRTFPTKRTARHPKRQRPKATQRTVKKKEEVVAISGARGFEPLSLTAIDFKSISLTTRTYTQTQKRRFDGSCTISQRRRGRPTNPPCGLPQPTSARQSITISSVSLLLRPNQSITTQTTPTFSRPAPWPTPRCRRRPRPAADLPCRRRRRRHCRRRSTVRA